MPETRVLLIEDTEDDAVLIIAQLRASGDFSVSHVETLEAGCELLQHAPDTNVVILDLNLPDSSGLDTFSRVHEQFPAVPVVILSGDDDTQRAVEAVSLGAQDYVPKSQSNGDTLVRSLRYAIERNGRRLAEERNRVLEQEMAAARRIQQRLLPSESPKIAGLDIAGICRAADVCAGDYFDFIASRDGTLDFLVADVSTHGFGPALTMVDVRRVIRTCAPIHEDVGKILTTVNRALAEDSLEDQFVTLFFARFDPGNGSLTYAAAGHPAWILPSDGAWQMVPYQGIPLGVLHDREYEVDGRVEMQPGEILLLMTDGAWEAMSANDEPFGHDRVFELIREYRQETASAILDRLVAELAKFCHPGELLDDVTVVLAKVESAA